MGLVHLFLVKVFLKKIIRLANIVDCEQACRCRSGRNSGFTLFANAHRKFYVLGMTPVKHNSNITEVGQLLVLEFNVSFVKCGSYEKTLKSCKTLIAIIYSVKSFIYVSV